MQEHRNAWRNDVTEIEDFISQGRPVFSGALAVAATAMVFIVVRRLVRHSESRAQASAEQQQQLS